MKSITEELLKLVSDWKGGFTGAFNIREDGGCAGRQSTEHIKIEPKQDLPGLDIHILPGTKGESVSIPACVTHGGVDDLVYNDFFVGEGADVRIVAGCGIHNCGDCDSQHDGIHTFYVGKNAKVTYIEKHYGEGNGEGERILNPTTNIYMEEGSFAQMDMSQIRGVDSTERKTYAKLGPKAKLVINEKLMTHGRQHALSDVSVDLDGEDSVLQIVSRSVGKDDSVQVFHPIARGNSKCRAHVQCDSILMGNAKISSIPEIAANHVDAQVIHEAAIGKINSDQLIKLQTFGLSEEEAEQVIVDGFLK